MTNQYVWIVFPEIGLELCNHMALIVALDEVFVIELSKLLDVEGATSTCVPTGLQLDLVVLAEVVANSIDVQFVHLVGIEQFFQFDLCRDDCLDGDTHDTHAGWPWAVLGKLYQFCVLDVRAKTDLHAIFVFSQVLLFNFHPFRPLDTGIDDEQLHWGVGSSEDVLISLTLPVRLGLFFDLLGVCLEGISNLVVWSFLSGNSFNFKDILLLHKLSHVISNPALSQSLVDLILRLHFPLLGDGHVGVFALEAKVKLLERLGSHDADGLAVGEETCDEEFALVCVDIREVEHDLVFQLVEFQLSDHLVLDIHPLLLLGGCLHLYWRTLSAALLHLLLLLYVLEHIVILVRLDGVAMLALDYGRGTLPMMCSSC